jgi:hypothetical protein
MKLDNELIEAYLDGSLDAGAAAKLKLWLAGHPADQAKVSRQSRLRSLLADSAVEPSVAQSRKMWANIKARAQAPHAAPVLDLREAWYAFIFKPWGGALSAGLATAALLVVALVWRPWTMQPQVEPAAATDVSANAKDPAAQAGGGVGTSAGAGTRSKDKTLAAFKKPAAKEEESGFAPSMDEAPAAAAAAPMLAAKAAAPAPAMARRAGGEADKAASTEPTEVERALADSNMDGMIEAQLAAVRQAPSQPSFERRSLSSPLAGLSRQSANADDGVADSKVLNAAQGGPDSNGFWDWRPAAVAMNRRDWPQVRIELDAARAHAAEPVERSFAGSALTLLAAPGAPLAGQGQPLPGTGELRVLGAGRWQLISDSRLARFSEGVSARLPGFRSDGDSLLLDLTFDRGTFSPGTRFTRVSGDSPASVLDAQGRAVNADEFSAPTGAVYNVSGRQLNLR